MADMTVDVGGSLLDAEIACRMVFGDDAGRGPVCATPKPLLALLADWPRDKTDQVVQIALDTPVDFDINAEMGRNQARAFVLNCCRVTVLHAGHTVGYALRTDTLGLNAIAAWKSTWEAHIRKIRQAH